MNLHKSFAHIASLVLVSFLVANCASSNAPVVEMPPPVALTAPDVTEVSADYRIGPLDKINVNVFGQEKLSVEKAQVDAGGEIVLPLIGAVKAGGKTTTELSREIAARLSERYLQSASVSIQIEEASSQRVTVTGAVNEAGVYPVKGKMSLMQALSLAKGPDRKIADMKQVAIFRTIDGRRARAVFDVAQISIGMAADPEVFGGDTIVVSESRGKSAWRELVGVLPALGIFAYF